MGENKSRDLLATYITREDALYNFVSRRIIPNEAEFNLHAFSGWIHMAKIKFLNTSKYNN
jgi:hypothetical protein